MMILEQARSHVWPSVHGWRSILRALSSKLEWDATHTVLCQLAQIAARRHGVSYAEARDGVDDLLVQHVYKLGLEFGLEPQFALQISQQLGDGLDWLRQAPGPAHRPYWPSSEEWLAIDQTAAGYIGMDPGMTVSTNLARIVALHRGMTPALAKRYVHRRIASHARELASEIGLSSLRGVVIQWRLISWLDSFDARSAGFVRQRSVGPPMRNGAAERRR